MLAPEGPSPLTNRDDKQPFPSIRKSMAGRVVPPPGMQERDPGMACADSVFYELKYRGVFGIELQVLSFQIQYR